MNKQLLNTLYVQTQGAYLRLSHDTLILEEDEEETFQIPLHHLGSIVVFGNVLITPALLARCSSDGRDMIWFSKHGRFKGRLYGPVSGNVLLRRDQHKALDDTKKTVTIAKSFVTGKVRNLRYLLQRRLRDGSENPAILEDAIDQLEVMLPSIDTVESLDELRGFEGKASRLYYGHFDELILNEDPEFAFTGRSRRPPKDAVNALLSFAYTLLANEASGALEGVGLDPQVGYLHALRSGRPSLSLDLIEEFRPIVADRAVLSLINRNQLDSSDFDARPGGAVLMNDEGRGKFLEHWQRQKQREIEHSLLKRDVAYGLLPHLQARLLARTIRGDITSYPPFSPK